MMAEDSYSGLLISDFNLSNFAGYLANDQGSPRVQPVVAPFGQVAQARGDREGALARYREGLSIFERLGMPVAAQVRQMIAAL